MGVGTLDTVGTDIVLFIASQSLKTLEADLVEALDLVLARLKNENKTYCKKEISVRDGNKEKMNDKSAVSVYETYRKRLEIAVVFPLTSAVLNFHILGGEAPGVIHFEAITGGTTS